MRFSHSALPPLTLTRVCVGNYGERISLKEGREFLKVSEGMFKEYARNPALSTTMTKIPS
jgi:hypothetical protein